MAELPDAWIAVLNALLDGPVDWRSPEQIAAVLGRDVSETTDVLCDLDLGGWVSVQETDRGASVALSALGAERLAVRLVEFGPRATLRWARADEPDPPVPHARHVCRAERAAALDFLVDPSPSPEAAAESAEDAEALARAGVMPASTKFDPDAFPRPSLLIGTGLTPWPGPVLAPDAVCPACGGGTLGPQMYCLYCDRWGLDVLTPTVPSAAVGRSRQPQPQSERGAFDRRAAEQQRARRKEKRKFRHLGASPPLRRSKTNPISNPNSAQAPGASKPASASAAR
jgi:hypothetical protein